MIIGNLWASLSMFHPLLITVETDANIRTHIAIAHLAHVFVVQDVLDQRRIALEQRELACLALSKVRMSANQVRSSLLSPPSASSPSSRLVMGHRLLFQKIEKINS